PAGPRRGRGAVHRRAADRAGPPDQHPRPQCRGRGLHPHLPRGFRSTPMTTTPDTSSPAATAGAPAAPRQDRSVALLFAGLMVTMLLASLNQTVLGTALPTIVGEVHGVEHMSWLITAFILASTITMPIYGKVSDVLGRKPLLLVAITLFTGGSIIGAMAPDMNWLIVSRAVQGLGGGGLMVLSQAAIADVVPARERG